MTSSARTERPARCHGWAPECKYFSARDPSKERDHQAPAGQGPTSPVEFPLPVHQIWLVVGTRGVVSQAGPLFALPTKAPRSRIPALAPAPWPQPIPECSFCKGAPGSLCGAGGAFLSSFKDLMAMLSPPDIILQGRGGQGLLSTRPGGTPPHSAIFEGSVLGRFKDKFPVIPKKAPHVPTTPVPSLLGPLALEDGDGVRLVPGGSHLLFAVASSPDRNQEDCPTGCVPEHAVFPRGRFAACPHVQQAHEQGGEAHHGMLPDEQLLPPFAVDPVQVELCRRPLSQICPHQVKWPKCISSSRVSTARQCAPTRELSPSSSNTSAERDMPSPQIREPLTYCWESL